MTSRGNPLDEWLSLALFALGVCLMFGIFYQHWPVYVAGPHRHAKQEAAT